MKGQDIPSFDGEAQEALDAFAEERKLWRTSAGQGRVYLSRDNGDGSMTSYNVNDEEVAKMVIDQASMRAALASVDG